MLKSVLQKEHNKLFFGLVGDTSSINIGQLEMNDAVEKVMKVQEPFKKNQQSISPSRFCY